MLFLYKERPRKSAQFICKLYVFPFHLNILT